jgi:hypothetical protein
MPKNTDRLLREAGDVAEELAAKSKRLYDDAVDRLPEGSDTFVAISTGVLVLALGAFFLGKASARRQNKSAVEGIDFAPFYRLARLWLIARAVS